MRTLCLAVAATVVVGLSAAVHAQPAPRRDPAQLAADVAALQAEVAALKPAAVVVPTLAEAVQRVSEQLEVLAGQVAELDRGQKSIPEAVTVLDQLRRRVDDLAVAVSGLRTEVADIEQPHAAGAGGGSSYDKGFAWTTSDGRYGLGLDGYAQARWQAAMLAGDERDQAVADGGSRLAENTLRIRRGRFGGRGWLGSKALQWRLLFELVKSPSLLDYYVDYTVRRELVVRVGQWKSQFTHNFITSSTELSFPDRPQSIERLRYDRDVQVGAWGRVAGDRVGYFAWVGNGAGPNAVNDNIDFLVGVRGDAVVLGKRFKGYGDQAGLERPAVMVGAGVIHDLVAVPDAVGSIPLRTDVDLRGGRDNVRVISASGDATLRWKGLEVAAELVYRHEDWGTILEGQVMNGPDLADVVGTAAGRDYVSIHGEASYFVLPHELLAALRIGRADVPFLGVGGARSALPPGNQVFEAEGLVQLYGERGRLLGLQYAYSDFDGDGPDGAGDKQHRLILEAQLNM